MPSTAGMQASVTTSPLLAVRPCTSQPVLLSPPPVPTLRPSPQHRASAIVPERLQRMEDAYRARDFATFADLTMKV